LKSPLFKNINITNEKERIRLNRRVITFFICVLIAVFFWLLMSLSKEYSITVNFPVNYVNLPQDKVVSNHLPESIDIEIRSSGFNLLLYKFKQHRETIIIDINYSRSLPFKNHYYLLTNSRIDKITSQFSNDIKILKIDPDTIFLNFNKKMIKHVPVKANLKIEYGDQYQQMDTIKLSPLTIDISGAAEVLDKINYVETIPMNFKNITTSLSLKLTILKPQSLKLVEFSQSTVKAFVNVAKYTQASIELPVEVENLPLGYSLKTFPNKISVKYNVAFENYEKINAAQFRAIVDFKKIESGSNILKVQLIKYPEAIRAVKLNVEKVEFIIRK
jgi:YbbR domain-containing protein